MALTPWGHMARCEGGRPGTSGWPRRLDSERQPTKETRSVLLTTPVYCLSLVKPTVTVYPAKTQPLQHHNLLVCSVTGFYPGHVEVRWFRNGQEEAAGVVSTGLIPNGDWTFQTMVMLETVPQSGEVYSCRVEHPSLTSPVTVEWSERLSDSLVPQAPRRGRACP